MKEKEFINAIKTVLNSSYIGDDCAYIESLGVVISQDNLVEDVHFKLDWTTPYQLGWKSAMVNISDICASGANPEFLTVGLSLPENITVEFIKDFYRGMKDASAGVEIVGGDITGSDKVFISVTALGNAYGRKISSRKNAKIGQKIVVSGPHGSSGAGLRLLTDGKTEPKKFIDAHLMPYAQVGFSKKIAESMKNDYAMMDTSDGLMDALSQIAAASGVNLEIDFAKIPFDEDLKMFDDYETLIFFGGEDYQLVATVDEDVSKDLTVIGRVKEGAGVTVLYENNIKKHFSKSDAEEKIFKHFEA